MTIKQYFRARATAGKAGLHDAAEKCKGTEKCAVLCEGVRRTDSDYMVRSGSPEGHTSGQDCMPIAGGSPEAPGGSVFSVRSSAAPDLRHGSASLGIFSGSVPERPGSPL